MTANALPIDEAMSGQADAFLERMSSVLDQGALSVMISIGHRSGLFDAMAGRKPTSSAEIAVTAKLAERYVREWLAAMVTGGIVTYDPMGKLYQLPDAHAACLTRGAPLGNIAVYAQAVALMGAVQERLLECFRHGGGTAYDDYPCFHQFMAEDSAQTVVEPLFEHVLPLVKGLEERLDAGIDVLDAGCGRGWALMAMAASHPSSRFVGYDLSEDAIAEARRVARDRGLRNLHFEARDLSDYNEREAFDFITTFDAVHDQKDPQALIVSLFGALKPGGAYLMQDVGGSAELENNRDFPMATLLYAVSCTHCTPISLGQGGKGLGTMWGWETAEAMLKTAGFNIVERHRLAHDPMNVWFVSRKS